MHRGKNYIESAKQIDKLRLYDPNEALDTVVKVAKAKFDETVECHLKLGVDSRHADQQVRGAIVLPNGTGKQVRVLVFARGDNAEVKDGLLTITARMPRPRVRRAPSSSATPIWSSASRKKTGWILTLSSPPRI